MVFVFAQSAAIGSVLPCSNDLVVRVRLAVRVIAVRVIVVSVRIDFLRYRLLEFPLNFADHGTGRRCDYGRKQDQCSNHVPPEIVILLT